MLSQFFAETFITSSFAIMIENIIVSRKQIIEVPNKNYIKIKENINNHKSEIQNNEVLICD
jgi:hypothetical protein